VDYNATYGQMTEGHVSGQGNMTETLMSAAPFDRKSDLSETLAATKLKCRRFQAIGYCSGEDGCQPAISLTVL
jgi:hypothetical protein